MKSDPSSSFARVARTFSGHIYNQIVTIGVQIALVPVLLLAWGTERYGVWLVLSAIPTYLTFSDFGFTYIAKNEMTMRVAEGDQHGALVTYQSVFQLLNIAAAIVCTLAFAIVFGVRLGSIFDLGDVPEMEAKLVLCILAMNVVYYQYFLLYCGGARSIGRPAAEVYWAGTSRLGYTLVLGLTAWAGYGLAAAAAAGLVANIAFGIGFHIWLAKVAPWLSFGWTHCSRNEIKRLLNPSVSYMFVSVAWAMMIQGPVVVLGLIAQPAQVVVFSTSRTLVRLGTSATSMLNNAVWAEYSRLYGLKNHALFGRIFRLVLALTAVGVLVFIPATILVGNLILTTWTKGEVAVEQPFFTLLVLSVAAEMIWTTLFVPLAAINRHITISYTFAVLSIIGVGGCYLLGVPYGLPGTAFAVLVVHIVMIGIVVVQLIRHLPRQTVPSSTVPAQDQGSEASITETLKRTDTRSVA
jgi:O-antigen/teichoic acid export membrane protein